MARTFAIGDIHGCSIALHALLREVKPGPDDTVVTLGDYVDRGPDSKGVIDRLLALRSECRLIPLRGNHEIMMIESVDAPAMEREWRRHGGRETLHSYAPAAAHPSLADVPAEHWHFLREECLNYWETDSHFFVHANATPEMPLEHQPPVVLFWEFLTENPEPHISGKIMVCGHTHQESGWPRVESHLICLDTWAHGGRWLSCLEVETNRLIQANQRGHLREVPLHR